MGILGIAPNGELVSATGESVAEQIEIRCDDPRFLELAERKRPDAVTQFVGGTWSYMRDWGVGVNWCLMALGVYGAANQVHAQRWGKMGLDVIAFAFAQPELAYKIVSLKMRYTYSHAAFLGRMGGSGLINALVLTGGRYGRGVLSGRSVTLGKAFERSSAFRPANYTNGAMVRSAPVMGANFILALTGSCVLAVKHGNADIGGLFSAMLMGEYEGDPIGAAYTELYNQAGAISDMEIAPGEIEAMLAVLEGVEMCLKNPASFGSPGREPVQGRAHVPVGSVSSARPQGVFGSIEVGSETNALDVIADENFRMNSYEIR